MAWALVVGGALPAGASDARFEDVYRARLSPPSGAAPHSAWMTVTATEVSASVGPFSLPHLLRWRMDPSLRPHGFERGLPLTEGWQVDGDLHLGRYGRTSLSCGAVSWLQDPSAFRLLEGQPVPDRVGVPGFAVGRTGWPLTLGIGATYQVPVGRSEARLWGVGSLAIAF